MFVSYHGHRQETEVVEIIENTSAAQFLQRAQNIGKVVITESSWSHSMRLIVFELPGPQEAPVCYSMTYRPSSAWATQNWHLGPLGTWDPWGLEIQSPWSRWSLGPPMIPGIPGILRIPCMDSHARISIHGYPSMDIHEVN